MRGRKAREQVYYGAHARQGREETIRGRRSSLPKKKKKRRCIHSGERVRSMREGGGKLTVGR